MKKTKKRALYVFAALLGALFVLSCLAGFAACGGDEHDHTWDAGVVTTAATCEGAGVRTYTCTECGETKTETIAALGHDWQLDTTSSDYKAATCGDGVGVYVCKNCGASYTDAIEGTGDHTWVKDEDSDTATCEDAGTATYTCSVCGETKTEATQALGHAYELDTTADAYVAPKCEEAGTGVYVCSRCGKSYTEAIPATGHTVTDWTVTTDATCGTDGSRTGTCTVCNNSVTETIPATGDHTYDWSNGTKTPSSTEGDVTTAGYVTYTCSVCQTATVTAPYYNENGEFLVEAEDGLLYPDPSSGLVSFGVEEHHSGTSGNPASGGRNVKDFEDGSFVAFKINASEAVTGATLSVIGASNNNVLGASELDMSNAKVTLNGETVSLTGTYPTAGGMWSFNYTAWGTITTTIDLAVGDNILVFYGMEKNYCYNFDCIMIGLPEGSESVTLTDTTMGVEETSQGAGDGQDPLTVCDVLGHDVVGTYANTAWTYKCSVCGEAIELSSTEDAVASLTLEATDEDSLLAAGVWNVTSECGNKTIVPMIDVATTDANQGTIVTSNGVTFGIRYGAKTMVLNADIDVTSKTFIVIDDLELDLNGHTIYRGIDSTTSENYTSQSGVVQVGMNGGYGNLTVKDSSTEGTGKITGENGVTVRGDANSNGDISTFTLVSGTIEGSNIAVSTNGSDNWGCEVVNIKGGTVSGTGDAGVGVYMPNGTLSVTGGTISGTTGIEIKSGSATISGATVSTTVTEGNPSVNTNTKGTDSYGYAIAIISTNTSYNDLVSVTIGSGCTISGDIYSDALDVTDDVTELVTNIVSVDESLGLTRVAYTSEGTPAAGDETVAYYVYTVVQAGEET